MIRSDPTRLETLLGGLIALAALGVIFAIVTLAGCDAPTSTVSLAGDCQEIFAQVSTFN